MEVVLYSRCEETALQGAEFLDMSQEDFDAVLNVNLKGVFLVR